MERIETRRDALKDGQAEQNRQLEEIVSERDRLREKVGDLGDETDRLQRQLAAANSRQHDLGRSWSTSRRRSLLQSVARIASSRRSGGEPGGGSLGTHLRTRTRERRCWPASR